MLGVDGEAYELRANDRPVPQAQQEPVNSRFTRTLNVLQMLGALVAVVAGLGSAYTMYRTNYSPEATYQNLRANIVSMLDRNVDAGMRRALIRRDVETFEHTCSAADPDATAAFKTLLRLDKTPPAVARQQQPQAAVRKVETATASKDEPAPVHKVEPAPAATATAGKEEPAPVRKVEPAPAATANQPPPRAAAVASASATPEAPISDAAWLAAVRSALANHPKGADAADAAPDALGAPHQPGELPPPRAVPSPPLAAPALPPPASVTAMPAPQADHPVPPGAIPDAAPPDPSGKRSGIGGVVSEIPFFGKALADHLSR